MPYRSPKKTTGQETLTEAQRGNPQTLVPRRAQALCYRDAETDKTRAGGSRKYKEGLYLVFRNTCIDSTKDTGWLNRQERWQEMDAQAMQEWKMSNGEESPFLSKSSAILIPPPSLKLGTKLGGFFPLITVSNVNQGARDGATARGGFLLLIGRRSAQFLSGSCLHCPRNTVPLVATP